VIVGRDGRVKYSASVGKDGRRDIYELLEVAARAAGRPPPAPPAELPVTPAAAADGRPELFVSRSCGFCRLALNELIRLGATSQVVVRFADFSAREGTAEAANAAELRRRIASVNDALRRAGHDETRGGVPALFADGRVYFGADQVNSELARRYGSR
jgi:hypothetical protein